MSETTQVISPIHTSCKKCAYAKYDNITQIGCHLNHLDKFKNNNIVILEAYDEDKEFYVINDKKCIAYVTEDCLLKKSLQSIEDKIEYFYKHNYLKYTLWIDLKNFVSYDAFQQLSDHLKQVFVKPSNIIIIRRKDQCVDLHTYENVQKVLVNAEYTDIQWRIQTMLVTDMSEEQLIHEAVSNCKQRFLCVITDMPSNINKIISTADKIVHDDMDFFSILSNDNKSCIIFPISIYKYHLYSLKKELLKEHALYKTI